MQKFMWTPSKKDSKFQEACFRKKVQQILSLLLNSELTYPEMSFRFQNSCRINEP